MTKRYSVAEARQHLADVLDLAEEGEEVAIERRGVRFVVKAEPRTKRRVGRRARRIELTDPDVQAGSWTWTWSADGVRFAARPKR
jgi:antitoxin (DNA-binding transcriptional repressor) of toxin-antitoxin stability system